MAWSDTFRFRDCPWCGLREAELRVVAGPGVKVDTSDGTRWWTIVACPRCGNLVSLRHNDPDHADAELIAALPDKGQEVDVRHLPERVAESYREAIVALEAGLSDSAAVQLRKTLEAACLHFGLDVEKKPLVANIEELIRQGYVTKQFGGALHHVREVGNAGAHPRAERVKEEVARRALRFTTQVLRNLFEIPAELESLKSQKPRSQAGTGRSGVGGAGGVHRR